MHLPNLPAVFQLKYKKTDQALMYLWIVDKRNEKQRYQMKILNNFESETLYYFTSYFQRNTTYKYKYELYRHNEKKQESNFRPFKCQIKQENKIDEWNKIWIGYRLNGDQIFFENFIVSIIKEDQSQLQLIKSESLHCVEGFDLVGIDQIQKMKIAFEIFNTITNTTKRTKFKVVSQIEGKLIQACNTMVLEYALLELNKQITIQENLEVLDFQEFNKEISENDSDFIKIFENEINQCQLQIKGLKQYNLISKNVEINFPSQLQEELYECNIVDDKINRFSFQQLPNVLLANISNNKLGINSEQLNGSLEYLNSKLRNLNQISEELGLKKSELQVLLQNIQQQLNDCQDQLQFTFKKLQEYQGEVECKVQQSQLKQEIILEICEINRWLKVLEKKLDIYQNQLAQQQQSGGQNQIIFVNDEFCEQQKMQNLLTKQQQKEGKDIDKLNQEIEDYQSQIIKLKEQLVKIQNSEQMQLMEDQISKNLLTNLDSRTSIQKK